MAVKKKRPRGRPPLPKGEDRQVVLTIRLNVAERKKIDAAAKKAAASSSGWARAVLLERAEIG